MRQVTRCSRPCNLSRCSDRTGQRLQTGGGKGRRHRSAARGTFSSIKKRRGSAGIAKPVWRH